jgi:hypothetical protein
VKLWTEERYVTGVDLFEAYWRTILLDQIPSDYDGMKSDLLTFSSQYTTLRLFFSLWSGRFPSFIKRMVWASIRVWQLIILGRNYPEITTETPILSSRRMMRTENENIGLVPKTAREGDWVVLCEGGKVPLIVRPSGQD